MGFFLEGQLIDIYNREIFPAKIIIEEGKIKSIERKNSAPQQYILPGFIDAHIHIESSMLTPFEFSKIALTHGTVATVSDPHEIANVCGIDGIHFMIENARHSPLKINFGAPSCVPATSSQIETSGAIINSENIEELLQRKDINYLTEVMNFPGVLNEEAEVMRKISIAKKYNKPIDGHAPGLRGWQAVRYAAAGISTDHECVSIEEANDKLDAEMYILIRQGSAAKNFDALIDLFHTQPDRLMFCSDDKHPDDLLKGHINQLVARALDKGFDLFDILHAACILPVSHYSLPVGTLKVNDPADFIVIDDLKSMSVKQTYIDGNLVAENGKALFNNYPSATINNFSVHKKNVSDFQLKANNANHQQIKAIEALDGQLITKSLIATLPVEDGIVITDIRQDILKICVVNRYQDAPPAIGFIKGFGLKSGAIASSVAHDSHNIVAVGTSDEDICAAVNSIIENNGGISLSGHQKTITLPLPIAGLMSDKNAKTVAAQYESITEKAKALGSTLRAPFMTLSFMALPVIPSLKITDKGLFDVDSFTFTDVFNLGSNIV